MNACFGSGCICACAFVNVPRHLRPRRNPSGELYEWGHYLFNKNQNIRLTVTQDVIVLPRSHQKLWNFGHPFGHLYTLQHMHEGRTYQNHEQHHHYNHYFALHCRVAQTVVLKFYNVKHLIRRVRQSFWTRDVLYLSGPRKV